MHEADALSPPPVGSADLPRRGQLAARLALPLVGVAVVVVSGYMFISDLQRRALLEQGVTQQLDLLGSVLHAPAEDMLREDRTADLDQLLRMALSAGPVAAAVVLDAARAPVAGDAVDLPCLLPALPATLPAHQISGRASCGVGLRWAVQPLRTENTWLLMAVEQRLVTESVAAAVRRQIVLLLVLAAAVGAAAVLMLQRHVSEPLAVMASHVRTIAANGSAPPLRLSAPAGELQQLATVLNATSGEIQARHEALRRSTEERMRLELRLAQAEKFAMIGRLSGGLAHELGSPLSVIGMRAGVIQQLGAGHRDIADQAEAIVAEVARMTSFIQGLLHLSGPHGIVFSRVDARTVVQRVARDVARHVAEAGVDLAGHGPDEEVWVRGQEAMLWHALRNGVRNSIQALRTHPGPRRIMLSVEAGRDEVDLVVEDTGPGIAPHDLPLVFEPFHTTKPVGEGIGLGLSITRGIVEEHGGEIAIENRAEGGVRLTLKLPREPLPAPSEQMA